MANGFFADGRHGQVKIKGFAPGDTAPTELVTLCVKRWSVTVQKPLYDTSNTCNGDWQMFQVGKRVAVFEIDGQIDLDNNPTDSTVNLSADFCSVELYEDASFAEPTFSFPTAIVESIKADSPENGIISFVISGRSSGTVTIADTAAGS
jgi:hypothetical protein